MNKKKRRSRQSNPIIFVTRKRNRISASSSLLSERTKRIKKAKPERIDIISGMKKIKPSIFSLQIAFNFA